MFTDQALPAARMLAARLRSRDFAAKAVPNDVPTVTVTLSGSERAEIQIVTDEDGISIYHGRIIIPGQNTLLFRNISHRQLESLLERH